MKTNGIVNCAEILPMIVYNTFSLSGHVWRSKKKDVGSYLNLPGTICNAPTNRTKSVLDNSVLEMNVKYAVSSFPLQNIDKYGINYLINVITLFQLKPIHNKNHVV